MKITGQHAPLFLRVLSRRAAAVLLLLSIALALFSATQPLLGTLGYESAVLFALFAAWVAAILPLRMLRVLRRVEAMPGRTVNAWETAARWLHLTLAGWTLLLPAAAVLTANALRVPNCAMLEGALFWLLIPFLTTAFSTAVLLFFDALLGRRGGWLYYVLLLLLLLQPFVQIYTQPQIFAYNHVFGMFLGLSWDQTQPPFLTLLLYRLSTLSYVALLLITATALWLRRHAPETLRAARGAIAAAFLLPLAAVLFFFVSSDRLGFSTTYAFVRTSLGAEYRLGALRLVYDPASLDSAEVRRVAEEHLFQLDRVCAELGVPWKGGITSYLYPDSETKRRLLGTESSDLARPWRAEVHMTLDSWAETVKHELTHVVAGSFGPYPNRAPFVRVLGLTEGLAMAVEWSWGNRSLHEYAAGMMAQGILPHARECMGTAGFVTGASSRGYVASGSLTRWLIDTLGIAVIRRAYQADDLETATGLRYDEMDRRWRVFLGTVQRRLPDSLAVAYAFRRPSLFSAVCPRVVTERSRAAAEALRDGHPARALALYREAESLAPNARAAFGIVGALFQQRQWDSVIAVTGRYLADTTRAYSLFPMLLWKGASLLRRGKDGRISAGDSVLADRALTRFVAEDLPGWTGTFAQRLLRALHSASRQTLLPIVSGLLLRREDAADSVRLARLRFLIEQHPHDAAVVEEYMRAELAAATDDNRGAASRGMARKTAARRRALRAYVGIEEQTLPYELRMLAVRLYHQERDWPAAMRLLRHQLAEVLTPMQRVTVTEWMARCAWGEKNDKMTK